MFGDFIKFATRLGVAVAIIAIIVAPFAAITIPNFDYTFLSNSIGKAYAIMSHWIPLFPQLWVFVGGSLTLWIGIQAVRIALAAARITLNVFK